MPLGLNRVGSLASKLGLGALGLFLLMVVLRSSDASKTAQAFLLRNQVLRQQLGEPLEVGWWVLGTVRSRSASSHASLRIPVSGSLAATTAHVTLGRQHGLWHVTEASYEDAEGHWQALWGPGQRPALAEARADSPKEQAQRALVHAQLLYKSGQEREALEKLDGVVALDASNAEAWYWRAQVRTRLGEREQALQDLERACALGNAKACELKQRVATAPSP